MGWWPWTDTTSIEREISATYLMVQTIYNRGAGQDMSKLHNTLAALVSDLDKSADTVIANATESETEFQDVITGLEAVVVKLKQKIADDASQGGSTGGGSGAR
jgi:hypothetical protein